MTPDQRFDDPITVATYSAIHYAEMAQSRLESEGIQAFLSRDDAGGAYPQMQLTRGVRLVVRSGEADAARELLGEADLLSSPELPEQEESFYDEQRRRMWSSLSGTLLGMGGVVLIGVAIAWVTTADLYSGITAVGAISFLIGAVIRYWDGNGSRT